ncbi:type IV pilin [Halapricum desulfuricans]|uniref:Pilin/Flagellin, FlaG/FlaF family n=1 Tax=Halapricum desulfuricans TaxID=2841257 RepID=A0A897NVK2_9EURY|nr:type IV pilin N-terminal domain-containing protein [Halapricum desulfuricans]QSG14156.1 Pilin/Flagellin, FlaG/FlaF family [Halapricum desulfuricans]
MHASDADGRGVAPVIGVVLMVAITVLLASTAAVFFFEFGNDSGSNMTPTASFNTDYENDTSDTVTLSHHSGDALDTSRLTLVVSEAKATNGSSLPGVNKRYSVDSLVAQSELSAGSSITVSNSTLSAGTDLNLGTATVKLVWESSGSTSTTLVEWSGSDN